MAGCLPVAVGQSNLAIGKPVSASGPVWNSQFVEHLNDGILTNQTHPLASSNTLGFTYELDLLEDTNLERIELVNRTGCCPERLSNYRVTVFADGGGSPGVANWSADIRIDGSHSGNGGRDIITAGMDPTGTFAGRFLHVINLSNAAYNPQIAEFEVYEAPLPQIHFLSTDAGNISQTGDPALPTSATLSWSVSGAESVTLSGVGSVGASGMRSVSPAVTSSFVLTASNAAGTVLSTIVIGVDEPVLQPFLNEFVADNAGQLEDQEGESPDWIEIHNPNSFALSLEGYYLTDDASFPTQWRIPAAVVSANGYLVIFASSKDLTDPSEPLHTNFNLSKGGEYLALIDPDGVTVRSVFPGSYPNPQVYPAQRENRSYGLVGFSSEAYFDLPTPGAANGPGFAGFVEDTEFDIDRGFFTAPIAVTISTLTAGATIRYTVDGSVPSPSHGFFYFEPVPISSTTILRAMAYKSAHVPTNVGTQTYLFISDVITSSVMDPAITQHVTYGPQMGTALRSLPAISVVTQQSVNASSEVAASMEMLFPDGSAGFQEDCGVRHFGGAFTNFPKKNFRLYFRSEYGASRLREPIMEGLERGGFLPVKSFDQLELRGGSHDMKQRGFYLSNRFTDDIMLDMGNLNPHGRFVHLYLNGTYWGMYHLRERWNADMLSKYLGGAKDDYEAINGNWNVGGWAEPVVTAYDGDGSAWERIKSLRDNYQGVRPYLDVPHYIDYMLMFMYGNSEDEYRCSGPTGVGSGFKWFLNDADGFTRNAGSRTSRDTPGRRNGDGPGSIFSMLFAEADPDYRALLADRIHRHFFNDGAMTPARMRARLNARVSETTLAMIPEIARWRGGGGTDTYLWPSEWETKKNSYINSVLPGQTADVLGFYRSAGFYPSLDAPVFNQHGGNVGSGFAVSLTGSGTILYTVDGSDPRLPGGAVSVGASSITSSVATLLPVGTTWRFLDDGSNQGTAWRGVNYQDGAWDSGPGELGYGDGNEVTATSYVDVDPVAAGIQKNATTYFRTTISIGDPANYSRYQLRLKYDDSAAVYINGSEVLRTSNLPANAVFTTYATSGAPSERAFFNFAISGAALIPGSNVIAVEVHQVSSNSSDISFDLELTAVPSAPGGSPLILSRNTHIRTRAFSGGQWSALSEAFFTVEGALPVAPGDLVIAELHYNPPGSDGAEFVELLNVSEHAINLRGVRFTDGVKYVFGDTFDTVLAPGARLLLVASLHAFQIGHGIEMPVAGVYFGNFDNDGEIVAMETASGVELLNFAYGDDQPWPISADGVGESMVFVPREPGSDQGDPLNWRRSVAPGGTPLTSDRIAFAGDPSGDLDGNGVDDLLDYAFGTQPGLGTGIQLSVGGDGHLLLFIPRSIGADDVALALEGSSNLVDWVEGGSAFVLTSRVAAGAGLETLVYRSVDPVSAYPERWFLRVRADLL